MTDGKSSVYATNFSGPSTELWGALVNYESYRAIQSNLEGPSSISQVGLIPLEHQTRNPEAILKYVN